MGYEREMEDETGGDEEAGNEESWCATETRRGYAPHKAVQGGSESSSTS
jgi:hypothetical protein